MRWASPWWTRSPGSPVEAPRDRAGEARLPCRCLAQPSVTSSPGSPPRSGTLRFSSVAEALRELEAPEQTPPRLLSRRRVWLAAAGAGAALLFFGAGFATGRATAKHRPRFSQREIRTTVPHPLPAQRTPPSPGPSESGPVSGPRALSVRPGTVREPGLVDTEKQTAYPPQQRHRTTSHAPVSTQEGDRERLVYVPQAEASAAFDHSLSTTWRSLTSTDVWLQVDLGQRANPRHPGARRKLAGEVRRNGSEHGADEPRRRQVVSHCS